MQVILDGHNALHGLGIRAPNHAAARRELLLMVREVNAGTVVYFDAGRAPRGSSGHGREEGLRVVYVRDREADEAIVKRVRNAPRPSEIIVVTDDRELAGRVRQLGGRTRSVRSFFEGLGERPAPPEKPDRNTGDFSPEDFGLRDHVNLDHPPRDLR